MKFGLLTKLAVLLALVGVLAAGVTGFYAFEASRDLLVDSAKNKLLNSTQVLSRRMDMGRDDVARELQVLVNHPAALASLQPSTAASTASADALATLFQLVMEAHPAYLQLRLISASDYGLERVRLDRSKLSTVRIQGDDLQEKGHYAYVAQTLQLPAGATYVSRITTNHEITPEINDTRQPTGGAGQPMLQFAMPVVDAQGRSVGVVVVNYGLNSLFELLSADLPAAFTLILANTDGDILVHPDARKTFGFDRGRRVLLQDELPDTRSVVDGRQTQVVFETQDDGTAAVPLVGAFIAQSTQTPADEARLILGLVQPRNLILQETRALGTTVLQIVVGLCLACVLLAMLLARAWTQPINAVTAAAQRFANGLPPGDLPLLRRDEIGSLARSFQQMHQQITQQLADLHDNQEELEHLALHDMLTGLPNRRLFQERLEQALAHARRYGEQVCLLFIDLDAFKSINDEHGHDAGDEVLKTVAQRMQYTVREVDTVARLGGDEFVVLLGAAVSHSHLAAIASKLLAVAKEPISAPPQVLQVTASIGISRYPQDGQTAAEILATADQAMYNAKLAGRDSYRFFSAPQV
jgi:diguanylate cyclase (GGDEF)-like protein